MILISICYHLVVMRPRDAEITMEIFFQSWFNCHNNQNHKNNIMEPDPFKARQFPEFLYPLPPALSPLPGPKTAGHLIPGSRWQWWHLSAECGWGMEMSDGAGCEWLEISGFVIVKRRTRVKAGICPGPDITLLQRNIIFIRPLDIMELWPCRNDIRGKGFLQQKGCETRCYRLVIESCQIIIVPCLTIYKSES